MNCELILGELILSDLIQELKLINELISLEVCIINSKTSNDQEQGGEILENGEARRGHLRSRIPSTRY